MNPPQQRGGRSRYGPAQEAGQQQQQYPFIVDPTEAAGAAVRAFFPAPGAGEPAPPSSSSAAERARSTMQHGHHHYGGGAPEISLAAHGHGQGHHGIHHHRYHQFGVEGRQDGGGPLSASLPRHSSSPPGFFSSPVVDNGKPANASAILVSLLN